MFACKIVFWLLLDLARYQAGNHVVFIPDLPSVLTWLVKLTSLPLHSRAWKAHDVDVLVFQALPCGLMFLFLKIFLFFMTIVQIWPMRKLMACFKGEVFLLLYLTGWDEGIPSHAARLTAFVRLVAAFLITILLTPLSVCCHAQISDMPLIGEMPRAASPWNIVVSI